MEILLNCLVVGFGGALGSVSRYLLTLLPIGPQDGFPLITLGINITGAFCIGLIVASAGKISNFDPALLLFLKVGICGGFTTFSTFSLEAVCLLRSGQSFIAIAYMALSILLCMAAIVGAQAIVK